MLRGQNSSFGLMLRTDQRVTAQADPEASPQKVSKGQQLDDVWLAHAVERRRLQLVGGSNAGASRAVFDEPQLLLLTTRQAALSSS